MTAAEVAALGPGLAALMSVEQLEAAAHLLSTIAETKAQNIVSIPELRQVFMNHLKSCIRMPRGGAAAGGSLQTGFEMELVTVLGAASLFEGWPHRQTSACGRQQSWELRTMDELSDHLALESTSWGALQARPMAMLPGADTHAGVILAAPPFTVSLTTRPDKTTVLCVRFPIVLWSPSSDTEAVILPPDDAQGVPFYVDPENQPGYYRDIFMTWGRRAAGELLTMGFPMSREVRSHLPAEYASDCEPDALSEHDSLESQ
jgi:hypothetical protein